MESESVMQKRSWIDEIEQRLLHQFPKIVGYCSDGRIFQGLQPVYDHMYKGIKVKTTKKRKGTSSNKKADNQSKDQPQNQAWYNKAYDYWEDETKCPPNEDGVLAGYGSITPIDIEGSNKYLDQLLQLIPGLSYHRAADCAAGIGRVTKHLLLPRFAHVDLIEQSPRLLQAAAGYIQPTDPSNITYLQQSLQEFQPLENTYDVIWIQWVIGQLTDIDVITFLQHCRVGLTEHGVIILKDNIITDEYERLYDIDLHDNCVSRHYRYYHILFDLAGVEIVLQERQLGFPSELYPVYMIALRRKKQN